jgi:hypothetical protein
MDIATGIVDFSSIQVKPGDVIVRVRQTQLGNVNSQSQTLANLRELILGNPGTFVTLGYVSMQFSDSASWNTTTHLLKFKLLSRIHKGRNFTILRGPNEVRKP